MNPIPITSCILVQLVCAAGTGVACAARRKVATTSRLRAIEKVFGLDRGLVLKMERRIFI